MKITFEMTPEEFKELLTPGPNQITMYNEMVNAAAKSWMETMGAMRKNASLWNRSKEGK